MTHRNYEHYREMALDVVAMLHHTLPDEAKESSFREGMVDALALRLAEREEVLLALPENVAEAVPGPLWLNGWRFGQTCPLVVEVSRSTTLGPLPQVESSLQDGPIPRGYTLKAFDVIAANTQAGNRSQVLECPADNDAINGLVVGVAWALAGFPGKGKHSVPYPAGSEGYDAWMLGFEASKEIDLALQK